MPITNSPVFQIDTSLVSDDLIQFWRSLLGVSIIRAHMLRAQSHSAVPTSDASHESQVVTCTSDQQAVNQVFLHSFLRFDHLLE